MKASSCPQERLGGVSTRPTPVQTICNGVLLICNGTLFRSPPAF